MATERNNPYSNFNFIVERDGQVLGAFSEVGGLDSENTPIEYREGADATNAVRKLPGIESYTNITLKRGITGNMALWDWRKEVRDGTGAFPPTSTVTIKLLNELRDENSPAMTWTVTDAWPTKITGPSLSAKGNEIAIEQVDLAHSRIDIS
ncbi:phage tail protein [Teredinibacter sp. KSP-S5-2]|uniref:phage tail protein n=1 Tax=Teredinibacter sp. KSP-S5-2 TaxID=3034506 RepID=UPI0029351840|nr:phage tail protein [Teredinibacter sp. KSP-S5-2]WNO11501.1 phage tail protein [Teredinibacter sp. KSP-S5-2]